MSPFQLGAALAVLAGGLLAISARDSRWIAGGLVVALGLAAVLADPLPSPLALAIRLVAALLGGYLLLLALGGNEDQALRNSQTGGSPLGPITPALAALAAGLVGYATSGAGSAAEGPAVATGAGLALATLAVGPLLLGRDLVRIGTGVVLLLTAAELLRAGLAGTPGALEQAVVAGLSVATLGSLAAIVAIALGAGQDLSVGPNVPRETLFEAHRLAAATQRAAGRGLRRTPRVARPAPGPRRDAAHQLTLEERLRLAPAAEEAASAETPPGDAAPAEAVPADAVPDPPVASPEPDSE